MNERFTFTDLEKRAARYAVVACRSFSHPAITDDDLVQEAQIAIWQVRGKLDQSQPVGAQVKFLKRRAMGAIIDEIRRLWAQDGSERRSLMRHEIVSSDVLPEDVVHAAFHCDHDTPEAILVAKQEIARISAMDDRSRRLVEMMFNGVSGTDIAAEFGVTKGRVTQMHQALAKCLTVGPA